MWVLKDRRQVGNEDDITSQAARKEGNRSHYLRQRAPVRVFIYLTALSVFLYSYFMCYPGMKGTYFLHGGRAGFGWLSGRTAHNKMRRGWRGGGSFSGFKASKQLAQTEKVFPQRTCCSVLCSYPKHVPLHKRDQWTPSGNPDKKNYDF